LKYLFPRSAGNQWKIPKLLEQMNIAHNIYLFGSHLNIHTGPQEHNHIANSKKTSQHTQKRKRNFDWQLGNQLNDQYSINFTQNNILYQQSSNDIMAKTSKTTNDTESKHTNMASKFEVSMQIDCETNKIIVQYQWITASKKGHELSQSILELIVNQCLLSQVVPIEEKGIHVYGYSEYTCNVMTFRAHPGYKNETPWFDWVLIAWIIPNDNKQSLNNDDNSPDYVDLPNTHNDPGN